MDDTNRIVIESLHAYIPSVFDVTTTPDGSVVLHTIESRLRLSPQVMEAIDQARAEAAADREADMTKDSRA